VAVRRDADDRDRLDWLPNSSAEVLWVRWVRARGGRAVEPNLGEWVVQSGFSSPTDLRDFQSLERRGLRTSLSVRAVFLVFTVAFEKIIISFEMVVVMSAAS
jgi:hypothetical protein